MRYVVVVAVAIALALFSPGSSNLGAVREPQQAASPASQNKALLDQYCVSCHNQRAKTAGLMFDTMDLGHLSEDADVWERVVRKLRGGMMPYYACARQGIR